LAERRRRVTWRASLSRADPPGGCPPRSDSATGPVTAQRLRSPNQISHAVQICRDGSEPSGLDQYVAHRGRFGWASHHWDTARVCSELAEQGIACTAADDVHNVHLLSGQALRVSDRAHMSQRQAVQDAARELRLAGGRTLAGSRAGGSNPSWHFSRSEERWIVDVYDEPQRWFAVSVSQQA